MTFNGFPFTRNSVFRYPMDPAPRTAVLAACFRQAWFPAKSPIRVFPHGWSEEVAAFAPAAVAANCEQLFGLAAADRPPLFTHAVIVLDSPGDPPLSNGDRERLWRAFRVPVFEQIIGPHGKLLAAECEAHDGLHIETPGLLWADLQWPGYRLEQSACGCGRKTPRLASASGVEQSRSMAANAK
jgi:hypothetical protein